jgi:hypothetical protein
MPRSRPPTPRATPRKPQAATSSSADELRAHLAVPEDARDAKWRHRFYDLIDVVRLAERDPRIFIGPDGFPYFALDLPADGRPGTVTVADLVETATSRGFGIALDAGDEGAAWVFSYGDLATRRTFGSYELPRIGLPPLERLGTREVQHDPAALEILVPTETMLPAYVQPLLRRYFTQMLGVLRPGVVMMRARDREPQDQLVFRFSRDDVATDLDFENALAGITWFLPRHVTVSVLGADALADLESVFVPLLG